jgi:hypothetical protein
MNSKIKDIRNGSSLLVSARLFEDLAIHDEELELNFSSTFFSNYTF